MAENVPGFWERWWPRLRREPMAVCLLVSLLANYSQNSERQQTAAQHRADLKELQGKLEVAYASNRRADAERDEAKEKLILTQRETIEFLRRGRPDSAR